jgi:hypothetical protein
MSHFTEDIRVVGGVVHTAEWNMFACGLPVSLEHAAPGREAIPPDAVACVPCFEHLRATLREVRLAIAVERLGNPMPSRLSWIRNASDPIRWSLRKAGYRPDVRLSTAFAAVGSARVTDGQVLQELARDPQYTSVIGLDPQIVPPWPPAPRRTGGSAGKWVDGMSLRTINGAVGYAERAGTRVVGPWHFIAGAFRRALDSNETDGIPGRFPPARSRIGTMLVLQNGGTWTVEVGEEALRRCRMAAERTRPDAADPGADALTPPRPRARP